MSKIILPISKKFVFFQMTTDDILNAKSIQVKKISLKLHQTFSAYLKVNSMKKFVMSNL